MRSIPFRIAALFMVLCLIISTTACTTDQALADADVLVQIAGSLGVAVGAVSPADAAIVAVFSTLATGGVSDITAAVKAWQSQGSQSNLTKLQSTIAEVQSNLSSELQHAKITDPNTQAVVTKWVALLNSGIAALVAGIPALQAANAAAAEVPTPESLQARWASEVCANNRKCANHVKVHRKTAVGKVRGVVAAPFHAVGNAIGDWKFGG